MAVFRLSSRTRPVVGLLVLAMLLIIYKLITHDEGTEIESGITLQEVIKANQMPRSNEEFDPFSVQRFSIPVSKNASVLREYRLSKLYKIAYCPTPKTMSTRMITIFDEFSKSIFVPEAVYNSYIGWKYLTIVRNPTDRFLSGFLDRCIAKRMYCSGCYANMTCYLEKLYKSYHLYTLDKTRPPDTDGHHLAPQTWFCGIGMPSKNRTIIRHQSNMFREQFRYFLESVQKMETSDLNRALRQLAWKTPHATSHSEIRPYLEKILFANPYALHILKKIYYWDYVILKYPFPRLNDIHHSLRKDIWSEDKSQPDIYDD